MSQKVNYIYDTDLPYLIDEEALEKLIGGLPPKPEIVYLSVAEVIGRGLTTRDGSLFETKYTQHGLDLACRFDRVRVAVQCEVDPDGKLVVNYDHLLMDNGKRDPQTGYAEPGVVIAPLEFRYGKWWVHGMLQFRPVMGVWAFTTPGGFSASLDPDKNIRIEVSEEFGDVKVLFADPNPVVICSDRALYRNGVKYVYFVFNSADWEPAIKSFGNEKIAAKSRLALPLEATTQFMDGLVGQAVRHAQVALAKGLLAPYEE